VRTLVNVDRPGAPNVKLPLDMINTSTVRTLDPASALAAPVLSSWFGSIVDGDEAFSERYPLAILKEFTGLTARYQGALEGQLGAIWRENITRALVPGESAVPLNALLACERDGKPFIEPWIRTHGLFRLVDRLIETIVMPLWHLLVAHGVTTECHGQNLILVHEDGWPTRLVLRDFHDSLEYVPGYLTGHDPKPAIIAADASYADETPNRFFWMSEVEELRGLLMDALFVHTLSDLSLLLEQAYSFRETEFWRRVALRIDRYGRESGLAHRQARLKHDTATIATEPLLKRKLGLWQDMRPHHVANALSLGTEPKEDRNDQDRRQVV
jgi:siderophore synthetase component